LDTHVLDFPCKALGAFVQEPTAAGLLDAFAAAQAVAAAQQAQFLAAQHASHAGPSHVQAKWLQQLQQLSPAERHHLRTYLLQAKWFAGAGNSSSSSAGSTGGPAAGFNQQQLQVLLSLPIFEVHAPLPYEEDSISPHDQQQQPMRQQQTAGLLGLLQESPAAASTGAAASLYRALSTAGTQQQQLLLPPRGITNGAVLGSHFLRCESESEEAVLTQHLGVRRLSMQEFLMLHLAKAPQQLQPRALTSTMVYILSRLKDLATAEADLLLSIRGLPVIPTRAGASQASVGTGTGTQRQQQQQQLVLAAPFELFDPSNAGLVQLLDARHFPAAPFDGSVDSSRPAAGVAGAAAAAAEAQAVLAGLTLCGLRTELNLEVSFLCFWLWVALVGVSCACSACDSR
jgi:hypothetical protein